jgi:PhnB protein
MATTKKKVAKKAAPKKAAAKKAAPKKAAPKKAAATKPAATVQRTNSINGYLTFNGNCETAFKFYKSVFGGEFTYVGRFKDMPQTEGMPPVPKSEANKIMHIMLPISKETSLMGSDSSDAFGQATIVGNNFSLSVNAASKSEADRIFKALGKGGKITMPINKIFWGSYFGMLVDKFGIQWMVSFDEPRS